jgi:hypothetical protein
LVEYIPISVYRCKTPEALPEHVFEIDAEIEEKEKDEVYT